MDIKEFRQKFPQYNSLRDDELADKLRNKFYPSMSQSDFDIRFGVRRTLPGKGFLASIRDNLLSLGENTAAFGPAAGPVISAFGGDDVGDTLESYASGLAEGTVAGSGPGYGPEHPSLSGRLQPHLHKPTTTMGEYAEEIGSGLTNPLTIVGGPEGLLSRLALSAPASIGSKAAGDVAKEGGLPETPARIAGGVLGALSPRAALRLGNLLPVSAERAAANSVLRQEGITPTAGQSSGRRWLRRAEGTLGEAPGAGGAAERIQEQVGKQFTRAALKRVGVNADLATPETLQNVKDRLSDTFENVAKKLTVHHDAKIGDDFLDISADLMKEGLPEDAIKRINAQINNIMDAFVTQNSGKSVMNGAAYQALTRKGTPLARAIEDPDPNVAYYATRVRSALDDALERTATRRGTRPGVGQQKALQDLKDARRQWYNMLVISKAAAGAGEAAPEGIISPQKLRQLLTSGDDRKIQYAMGKGDLSELTRAGNQILSPLPNSNTAERGFLLGIPAAAGSSLGALLTGEPVAGGMAGLVAGSSAPGLAGRALLSKPVQSVLRSQATKGALDQLPSKGAISLWQALSQLGNANVEHPQENPPVPGAKRSFKDGKWYVPDPKRPGKYLRVDQAQQ